MSISLDAHSWILSRRRVQLDHVQAWLAGRKPPVFIDGGVDIVSVVHASDDRLDLWLYNCGYDPTDAATTVHVRNVRPGARVTRFSGETEFTPVDEGRFARADDEILLRLDGAETLRFMEVGVYRIARA